MTGACAEPHTNRRRSRLDEFQAYVSRSGWPAVPADARLVDWLNPRTQTFFSISSGPSGYNSDNIVA